jgi:ketosteroid isomerase-like protein
MRRITLRAFVTLLLASLFILAGGNLMAADNATAKTLMNLDNEWSKAAVAHDMEKLASYYADDAHVYPPNQPAITGRAAAKEAWSKMLADSSTNISWKSTAAGADGNTGWTTGTYELHFKGPDGKPASENGKYLCVWRKESNGKWKALYDMWNSDSK